MVDKSTWVDLKVGLKEVHTDTFDLIAPRYGISSTLFNGHIKEVHKYIYSHSVCPSLELFYLFPHVEDELIAPLWEAADEEQKAKRVAEADVADPVVVETDVELLEALGSIMF